jgi:hypothetical protein
MHQITGEGGRQLIALRRKPVARARDARRATVEPFEPRLLFAVFEVTNTFDTGPGSLRQAIIDANHPEPGILSDRIVFRIPGPGVPRITPASPLPAITDNVIIDGFTEGGAPGVELNGAGAGAGASGLHVTSTDPVIASEIWGLIINGFSGNGISINGNGNQVVGTWIGTDATGTAAGSGNGGHGVQITGSHNAVLGCVIAHSRGDGVAIVGVNATGNDVQENRFVNNGDDFGDLPIDLGDDGPTPNDPLDADAGPNELQNAPVITSVTPAERGGLRVQGNVHTTPRAFIRIVLYAGDPAERHYAPVHRFDVQTDANGNASFDETLPGGLDDLVAATAHSTRFLPGEGVAVVNTSEFTPVWEPPRPPVESVYVGGTAWTDDFRRELHEESLGRADLGFRLWPRPDENEPLPPVPWSNVNRVAIAFNGRVAVSQNDLVIRSGAGIPYHVTSFTFDEPTGVAVWTLDRPFAAFTSFNRRVADVVTLSLWQGGAAPTVQPASSPISWPPVNVSLPVVPGDANRNGNVSPTDFGAVRAGMGRHTLDEGTAPRHYTVFRDVNGNGNVSPTDLGVVRGNTGAGLVVAPPPAISSGGWTGATVTREVLDDGRK